MLRSEQAGAHVDLPDRFRSDSPHPSLTATRCHTRSQDLPLKKMLYLYMRSTARQNSEVSLLVVQQFLNDTNDIDPRIRGLAVRYVWTARCIRPTSLLLPSHNLSCLCC